MSRPRCARRARAIAQTYCEALVTSLRWPWQACRPRRSRGSAGRATRRPAC